MVNGEFGTGLPVPQSTFLIQHSPFAFALPSPFLRPSPFLQPSPVNSPCPMSLVRLGRYRDLANAVAERLASAEGRLEGIVASSGVRSAVLGELLRRTPSGVASVRLDGIDAFARRV